MLDVERVAARWRTEGTYTEPYWSLTGNAGIDPTVNFLGTTDSVTMTLAVSDTVALRMVPTGGTPNLIGGYSDNSVETGVMGATISGGGDSGLPNQVTGFYGTIGGGHNNRTEDYATVGGGDGNTASGAWASVGGGFENTAGGEFSAIGGGDGNIVDGKWASVGGGAGNTVGGEEATVGGGRGNIADGTSATVGGGFNNTANSYQATVGGGDSNVASGSHATVGGGVFNDASGELSTVPGGERNVAGGEFSFAAGQRAKALHRGTFVWSDSHDFDFDSDADNEFAVRSTGGARFVSAIDGSGNPTAGVQLAAGGNSWSAISDRNLKENFTPIDKQAILDELSQVPITVWNLKSQDPSIRHIGPMAQDFYAAFGLGESERYISSSDVDGVALTSIQSLYKLLQEREAQITAQQQQIAELEARLAALEQKVGELSEK